MAFLVLLSDRTVREALPALAGLGVDVKLEPLSLASVDHVAALLPEAVLIDAGENPAQGFAVLTGLRAREARLPLVAVVERADLERYAWEKAADELVYPGAPESELRLRFSLLRRRTGAGDRSAVRLGPLVLDVESYRAVLAGRSLDLTYKEFELLRFLASRPGRASTRPSLLREVWGYDFYGGTRTVDVHVRRLRAKLGPEHEWLIETVRGVGYRAADPETRDEPGEA